MNETFIPRLVEPVRGDESLLRKREHKVPDPAHRPATPFMPQGKTEPLAMGRAASFAVIRQE
jgi:hypothetical protein